MKFRNFRSYRGPNDGEGNDLPGAPERSGGAVGTGNNARVALLEAINDRVDEERADQLADVNDDETTSEFVPGMDAGTRKELQRFAKEANQRAGDEEDEDSSESGDAVDTGEQADAAAPITPKLFKVRIAGVDREFTEEQLIERASKVESADVYLAEAARIKREAQQTPNTLAQPSKDAALNVDSRESLRAPVRAIQMGTEEEAIDAFVNAVKSLVPSAPSADELLRTVDERLDFKSAVSKFQTEYEDVMSVPIFRDHVLRKDEQLLKAGDKRDFYSRWASLAEEARTEMARLKGPTTEAPAPAPASNKQTRKAAATPAPKPAGVRAGAPVPEDEREESASEIIAGMAKNRGGPQWARA